MFAADQASFLFEHDVARVGKEGLEFGLKILGCSICGKVCKKQLHDLQEWGHYIFSL